MKKNVKKKRKSKRKISIITCSGCNKQTEVERATAKYCDRKGKNCKKNESLFRIAKGYIYRIKGELNGGLKEFYNDRSFIEQPTVNPFKKEIKEFMRSKKSEDMLRPWKQEFDGFILYFYPHLKKNYDIFFSEKRKQSWERYLLLNSINKKKVVFRNYDLEKFKEQNGSNA